MSRVKVEVFGAYGGKGKEGRKESEDGKEGRKRGRGKGSKEGRTEEGGKGRKEGKEARMGRKADLRLVSDVGILCVSFMMQYSTTRCLRDHILVL